MVASGGVFPSPPPDPGRSMQRRIKSVMRTRPGIDVPLPPRWRTGLALLALFLFDVVVIGQGAFAGLTAAVGLGLLSLGTFSSGVRGHRSLARNRASRAIQYLLLGLATIGTLRFHEATGRKNAQRVISACESYRRQDGKLPDRLEELVPEFLSDVPPSRYTVLFNHFWYFPDAGLLGYVVFPPFGRRTYNFNTAQWNYLD